MTAQGGPQGLDRAGAASATEGTRSTSRRPDTGWQTSNWRRVNETVRRLQARIVKAQQAGRGGKVKAVQHLLTHSFSGRALAVRRGTENQGKRTPGVDGHTWSTPHEKMAATRALRQHGYRPPPRRRGSIPKSNGRLRPLGIPMPTAYCTSIQAA
jgi:RNA-directed DNA polymerase